MGINKFVAKTGIKINGLDIVDIHPDKVKAIVNSDETGILRAMITS